MSQYFNEHKLDEDKSVKLIVACANANRDEVDTIIERDKNIRNTVNLKNNQGETALHVTATGGDHVIIQKLLDNGADMTISDKQGCTPLMRASAMGNLDAVQVFLSFNGENLFFPGTNGQTPLHCACLISNMPLISQFIELDHSGQTLKMKDKEGNSPFLAAANPPCNPEVLNFLLEHGSDINEQNNKGETALLIAARAGATPAVRFLLGKSKKTLIH